MAWTEQDYQGIVARLMAESIGVNEVPDAGSTDDISSLPAYQPANGTEVPTVVKASLELLVAPALDAADKANEAADKANEAADKAENNATTAQTAANTANEKAEQAAQAASDATAAKEEAEAATQSANNAASNAEEKAEAANTAAQDAEKVANNPTYIGTDHYVYVYNKETDSFDKTGIYCKGEPGSSFRVAGEYATLEALKSAVPDGSAVDGFMAVGTEAPYDYYAWVNGDWVNQGKIAGGGSGNVVVIPVAAMSLSGQATSDEIFNAFGGKDAFMDICQSIVNKDTVCVVANIPDSSGMKLVYTPVVAMATYTDANNANFMMAIITQTTFQLGIAVTDGIATQSSQVLNHIYEAPSDGNVYGRKNEDWVKVPENSNVIILPKEILDLTGSSSSEEILAAFGGIDKYKDLLEKLSTNNCLVQIGEPSLGSLRHIYTLVEYAVNFASNKQSGALSLNIYNEKQQLRRLHFYLENNGTTARCGEASTFQLVRDTDVLTKTNTSSFIPTQPYHPATKKYVDDKVYVVNNSTWEEVLRNNKSINGTDVQALVNKLFGSYSEFLSLLQGVNDNVYIGLKFTDWMYDDVNGYGVGSSYTASNLYAKHNTAEGEFNCNFTYFYKNALKCCIINVNEASNHNYDKLIIQDIVTSDNLTTITKKTAAEYEALGSKDANTAYCVTD